MLWARYRARDVFARCNAFSAGGMNRPIAFTAKMLLVFIWSALIVFSSGCSGSYEPSNAQERAKCYATEFGAAPPPGLNNLQAKQVIVGDAGGAWLRFEANSNVLSGILSNRFSPSDRLTFLSNSRGGNTPRWWNPEADALTSFYISNQWRPGSNYSVAVIGHDASRRVVYFHHGISF
jgi:hypothetical protein